MPGKWIANRFEINDPDKDLLGRGGMGEVYRATDTQTGETVAVKELNPEILAHDPGLLERFKREGEALRQLNHPNIVRMIEAIEEGGRHYLVMEYVRGGSLQDLLSANEKLSHERVIQISLDLADALTRAHRLGIIHRDLKPANVLLAEDGTPRLTDFGVAYIADTPHLTRTGVLVGTVDYLSPEACNGEKLDERADIWAFGVMLFQMLTGRLPFKGESLTAKLTAILTQPIPDITQYAANIPDALADLIYRMLEKDPQQRIPSIRLVGAELEAMLKGRAPVIPSHPVSIDSRFEMPSPSTQKEKHNLPPQPTLFIGRQAELTELSRLLNDPAVHLVTIVGAGGMGKTRLALEAGASQLDNFPNGVYFVPLAALDSNEAIVPTMAQALDFSFHEGGEPRQQLLDYLREKSILLILDNFEHLLDGAGLVTEILQTAPQVKILCTTRTRLDIPGEQIFHLEGMEFPEWRTPEDAMEYSAVKLFLQSARRVRPAFTLDADDLQYVARICRVVGGMPLGILLAAAWVEMLTPHEIADEMQRSLDFLETDQQSVPERQRSMRGVFSYAWNSLTEREQKAFRAISVFRGGFTREAAQEVTKASLRELMGLMNKSLLTRTPSGWYEIHEFLRQSGAKKLSENSEEEKNVQECHCAYFAKFINQRESALLGPGQINAIAQIDVEVENVRVGWQWAVDQKLDEQIVQFLNALAEFYRLKNWFIEGEKLFDRAAQKLAMHLSIPDSSCTRLVYAKVLLQEGRFCVLTGNLEKSKNLFADCLDLFRKLSAKREIAYVLCYLSGSEGLYGGLGGDAAQESLSLMKEINDDHGAALALRGLAWSALHNEEYILSKRRFMESLEIFRRLGDTDAITTTLGGLGFICFILGENASGYQYHQEMLAICQDVGNQDGVARALGDLGIDSFGMGDFLHALDLFQQSLALYREIGNIPGICDELIDLAMTHNRLGNYEQAFHYIQDRLAIPYEHVDQQSNQYAALGDSERGLGRFSEARKYFIQALERSHRANLKARSIRAIVGIAYLLADEGQKEKALEMSSLALHHPMSWQMEKDHAAHLISVLENKLPPEIVAAAVERGEERDLEATIENLLIELRE
jgi:serine/threonine protein kinase/tetratricopeptide (TPR) repeat protein